MNATPQPRIAGPGTGYYPAHCCHHRSYGDCAYGDGVWDFPDDYGWAAPPEVQNPSAPERARR